MVNSKSPTSSRQPAHQFLPLSLVRVAAQRKSICWGLCFSRNTWFQSNILKWRRKIYFKKRRFTPFCIGAVWWESLLQCFYVWSIIKRNTLTCSRQPVLPSYRFFDIKLTYTQCSHTLWHYDPPAICEWAVVKTCKDCKITKDSWRRPNDETFCENKELDVIEGASSLYSRSWWCSCVCVFCKYMYVGYKSPSLWDV